MGGHHATLPRFGIGRRRDRRNRSIGGHSLRPGAATRARGPRLASQSDRNSHHAWRYPPEHPFLSDPSGGFSRTIFETDEDPNFKIIIRDFAFPPDRPTRTVTLPSGAFLHILGGQGDISIGYQRLGLTVAPRMAVPAGAPLDVVNSGELPVVVRALIVEAK
jgi:hypothetical protein